MTRYGFKVAYKGIATLHTMKRLRKKPYHIKMWDLAQERRFSPLR